MTVRGVMTYSSDCMAWIYLLKVSTCDGAMAQHGLRTRRFWICLWTLNNICKKWNHHKSPVFSRWYKLISQFSVISEVFRTLSLILSCSRSSSSGLTSTEMAGMWGRTEHVEDTCQVTKDIKVWTKYGICLSMKSVSPPNPVVSPKEIAIFGGHSELKKSFCYLVILSKMTILMVMLSWWYPFPLEYVVPSKSSGLPEQPAFFGKSNGRTHLPINLHKYCHQMHL